MSKLITTEHIGCKDDKEYEALHYEFIRRRALKGHNVSVRISNIRHLPARVEHGRWLADCPCGAGMNVRTDVRIARCGSCGCIYHDISLPANLDRIETELLKRVEAERNWNPGETDQKL